MANSRRGKLLVADPEGVTRFGLINLFGEHPQFTICGEAETLGEARDQAARSKPDLLIFDPSMGDCIAFLKELADWSNETRAVAFTNRCDALSVQRALKAGVCGYVSRRDPITALVGTVLSVFAGERHLSPMVQRTLIDGLAHGRMEVKDTEESCLSDRELQVYRLFGQGLGTRAVAVELGVSIKTIETHRQRIREKLRLASGNELQRRAVLYTGAEGSSYGR